MSTRPDPILQERGSIDLRGAWNLAVRYWYLFVASLGIALGVAFFYLRYTQPMYQVEAHVLIKDEKSVGEDILLSELGLGKKTKNLENEVLVMLSTPLMADVVLKNNLHYRYFREKGPTLEEIYGQTPVQVLDWSPNTPRGRVTGTVEAEEGGGYRFTVGDSVYHGEFGGQLALPEGKLILWTNQNMEPGSSLIVMALSVAEMTGFLQENLDVSIAGEESSTLVLRLKDPSPQRAHDALMGLVEAYNKHSIDDKNLGYEGAIRLINERLDMVADELAEVEMDVESYKRGNMTVELSAEGGMLLSEMAAYDHRISDLRIQLEVLDLIDGVLAENVDGRQYMPTNLSINNVTLSNELLSFNTLLAELEKMERKLGPDHPDLQQMARQLGNLRESIVANLATLRSEFELMLGANIEQKQMLASRTRSIPTKERELVERTRRKGVIENLYLYLLEKREEAAISMAITTSTGSIIEPAVVPELPVSPKRAQIWLIAFFLGLAFPAGALAGMTALSDLVEDVADVRKITTVPVLGAIGASRNREGLVVKATGSTVVGEMFRLLRADLMYLAPGQDLRTLLITSSRSGEGKSFIAMNLGMILAMAGKKVAIVELDLRKPRQERYMGLARSSRGVVGFIVDASLTKEDVLVNSGHHPNLDLIPSGPIPPDPGELIMSSRLRLLVTELRRTYDMIILDSPPVGLVADALQLSDLAQATMYVVRAGFTRRSQLKVIEEVNARGMLPKTFIVLNGVRMDGQGPYGGYGYGYGVMAEEDRPWHQRLLRRLPFGTSSKHAS